MPRKKCAFGFSCASMMLEPGLTAEHCPNAEVCGTLTELTPLEEVELIRVRQVERERREEAEREWQEQWERIQERFRVNQRQAAQMMLISRGCPQSIDSLGVSEAMAAVESRLSELWSRLGEFEGVYIAPPACEVHAYNVKRPSGTYFYNKLTAEAPIFEPSEKNQKVRVIHLSHEDDARNLEAREGIERRNKLLGLAARLIQIEQALDIVLAKI